METKKKIRGLSHAGVSNSTGMQTVLSQGRQEIHLIGQHGLRRTTSDLEAKRTVRRNLEPENTRGQAASNTSHSSIHKLRGLRRSHSDIQAKQRAKLGPMIRSIGQYTVGQAKLRHGLHRPDKLPFSSSEQPSGSVQSHRSSSLRGLHKNRPFQLQYNQAVTEPTGDIESQYRVEPIDPLLRLTGNDDD